MSLQIILKPIADDLEEVEKALSRELRSEDPTVDRLTRHLLSGRGKLLRPALVLLSSRSVAECTPESAIRAGAVIELIHMASLVHDDMVDGAETRRGIPTINAEWDDRTSVLAGDHLYSKALVMLHNAELHSMLGIIADTVCRMSVAELAQTQRRGDVTMREDEYLAMVGEKTASLMSASCRIGSVLAGGSAEERDALSRFGWFFGISFQIVDDLLDFVGSKRRLGKPIGADIRSGWVTLPLLYALEQGSAEDRRVVARALAADGSGGDGSLEKAIALVRERGGVGRTRETALVYRDRAKGAIEQLAPSPAGEVLLRLADFVVDREE